MVTGTSGCLSPGPGFRWRPQSLFRADSTECRPLAGAASLTGKLAGGAYWLRPARGIVSVLGQERMHPAFETEGNADALHRTCAVDCHVKGPAEKVGVIVERTDRQPAFVRKQ